MNAFEHYPTLHDAPRSVQEESVWVRRAIYQLQQERATASVSRETKATGTGIGGGTQVTGENPLNIAQLIGQSAQPQKPYVQKFTSLPNAQDPASQDGNLVSVNGVLYRFDGSTTPGTWKPQSAIGVLLQDTYANWTTTNYPPASYTLGTQFLITDWNVIYDVRTVASVNTWVFVGGVYIAAFASRPTTGFSGVALGTNDTGLEFYATDKKLIYYWDGAAWQVLGPPALASAQIWVGNASGVAASVAMSADATLANTGALTLATVNSNVGTFGDATDVGQFTVNAKGLITAAASVPITFPSSPTVYWRNATDQSVTSSTTLVNATALSSIAISSGSSYVVEARLLFTCDVAGGIKTALQTSATIAAGGAFEVFSAGTLKDSSSAGALLSTINEVGVGFYEVTINGSFSVSVSGNLNVQFAQSASSVTATKLKPGSYIHVQAI